MKLKTRNALAATVGVAVFVFLLVYTVLLAQQAMAKDNDKGCCCTAPISPAPSAPPYNPPAPTMAPPTQTPDTTPPGPTQTAAPGATATR